LFAPKQPTPDVTTRTRPKAAPAAPWRSRIVGTGEETPDQLLANPRNFRVHPKPQQDALAGVLSEVGWVQNVLVNRQSGHVIDGHLRVSLAISRGEPKVPVVYVDLTPEEEALVLATFDPISALAGTDKDILGDLLAEVSTQDAALQEMLEGLAEENGLDFGGGPTVEAPEPQLDRAEELREKWQTKTGQLWVIGRHRLVCGDSTKAEDVARLMDGARYEVLWTDPPYGVAVGDKNRFLNSIAPSNRVEENLQNDTLDEAALEQMLRAAFGCAKQHGTAGASWYVTAPAVPLHLLFGQVLKDMGIYRQTIIWVKDNATFAPLGVPYHWRHEPMFFGWLPTGAHRDFTKRTQDTVWEIDRPMKSPEHPTMKPPALVERSLENSSKRGDVVLDLFVGSGTTYCAADALGRVCYGVDIDPKYVAVTLERLAEMGLEPRLEAAA
jgi:DNA modification methylase